MTSGPGAPSAAFATAASALGVGATPGPPADPRSLALRAVRLRRTEVLVPAGAPRGVARALRRRSGFSGRRSVALTAVAARAARLGLLGRGPATLHVGDDAPLLVWLRDALGRTDLTVAIGVGVPRPNAKPVVTVMSRRGDLLAVAKVGTSPYTDELVAAEAGALERLATTPLPARVPRRLATGEVGGHPVVLQEALESWDPLGRPTPLPPAGLVAAIAAIDAHAAPLASSGYGADLAGRLRPTGTRVPELALRPDDELHFGAWHGDFTPWNLVESRPSPRRPALAVWDWERFATGVPKGFDVLHWVFHARRLALGDAAAIEAAEAALRGAGLIAPAHVPAVATLYLAEMVARFGDPRLAVVPEAVELTSRLGALLAHRSPVR